MTPPTELLAKIDEAITHYPASKRSASLPLLHLWQEHFGFISDEAIAWIAAKLELQPINILELVTFYPMFRRAAGGRDAHPRLPHALVRDGRCVRIARARREGRGDRFAGISRGAENGGRPRAPAQSWSRQPDRRVAGWKIFDGVRRVPRELRQRAGRDGG